MIASHVTAKRLVTAFLGMSMALLVWRLWPLLPDADVDDEPAPAPRASYTLYPLSGDPLWWAVNDLDGDKSYWGRPKPSHPEFTTCLPFYAPLLEHPHWEIQIVRGASSCTTDGLRDSFTADARGHVTWWRAKRPLRDLELTPAEMAQLRTIDDLDCVRTEEVGYGEAWYRVSVGGDRDGKAGAHVSGSSTMAKALDKIFDAAVARYHKRRLAELGAIRADVVASEHSPWSPRAAHYKLELLDHHLTVRYDAKVLVDRDVEDDELVDLVDSALTPLASEVEIQHELSYDPQNDTIRGTLTAGGRTVAIFFTTFEYNALFPLSRALADAFYEHGPKLP